jgi:hypothetical protein
MRTHTKGFDGAIIRDKFRTENTICRVDSIQFIRIVSTLDPKQKESIENLKYLLL